MYAQQPIWGNLYLVPATMTGDELLRLPDDGTKNELYEGTLVREEMTSSGHGITCHRLSGILFLYAQRVGFTNSIMQNVLFDLTPPGMTRKTVLAPDLSIMPGKMTPANNVTRDIPLIAVEVVAPSQTLTELGIKALFYRNVGVAEVWLIDAATRVIEIWNAQGITILNDTQTLTSPLLPGFSVAVRDILDN